MKSNKSNDKKLVLNIIDWFLKSFPISILFLPTENQLHSLDLKFQNIDISLWTKPSSTSKMNLLNSISTEFDILLFKFHIFVHYYYSNKNQMQFQG